jgi:hypothetical protein
LRSRRRIRSVFPSTWAGLPSRPPDREQTLRFERADRRRLAFASALTIVALPAILLANREQDGVPSPNVAAVGLPAGGPSTTTPGSAALDPLGRVEPQFLSRAPETVQPPPEPAVAIGSADYTMVGTARATYRLEVGPGYCLFNGIASGEVIAVVNVDNGRSVECRTRPRTNGDAPPDELVLSQEGFMQLADLTDAPVPVELRQ